VLQAPEGLERKKATPPAQAKQRVIDEHNLVVYRLHDGWDGFPGYGMGPPLEEVLGWGDCRISDEFIYELAPTTVQELAATVARKLGRRGARFTGDPARGVKRVTLDWGSPGAMGIVLKALANRCDASITGEVVDWRDVEFARDAGVALIVAGHCATESPGMRSFHRWFEPQWPDLRVEFLDAGDPDGFVVVDQPEVVPA
jgi:putative NIF3 family GTP cyclohydrolase 1 type 2